MQQIDKINYDTAYVESHLYEAGKSIIRLSVKGIYPSQFACALGTMYTADEHPTLHESMPQNEQHNIKHMELVEGWVRQIDSEVIRRTIHLRMLVSPLNDRHRYSWRKIGAMLKCSHTQAKSNFEVGLSKLAGMLNAGILKAPR